VWCNSSSDFSQVGPTYLGHAAQSFPHAARILHIALSSLHHRIQFYNIIKSTVKQEKQKTHPPAEPVVVI